MKMSYAGVALAHLLAHPSLQQQQQQHHQLAVLQVAVVVVVVVAGRRGGWLLHPQLPHRLLLLRPLLPVLQTLDVARTRRGQHIQLVLGVPRHAPTHCTPVAA